MPHHENHGNFAIPSGPHGGGGGVPEMQNYSQNNLAVPINANGAQGHYEYEEAKSRD